MNVSLPSELENFVHKEVSSKRYQTASEVVRHALRLMQQAEQMNQAKLDALRRDLQVGLDQYDCGEYTTVRSEKDRDALLERIRRGGRQRLVKLRKAKSG